MRIFASFLVHLDHHLTDFSGVLVQLQLRHLLVQKVPYLFLASGKVILFKSFCFHQIITLRIFASFLVHLDHCIAYFSSVLVQLQLRHLLVQKVPYLFLASGELGTFIHHFVCIKSSL